MLSTRLVTKDNKIKCTKINKTITNSEQDFIIDGPVYEGVQKYKYLGSLINSKNAKSEKIKLKIAASDRRFYSLEQTFKSRAFSKTIKIAIYKTMVKPVEVYGSET